MKHAASRDLYAYWEERRGNRPAPERADIEPASIRQCLSDSFVLAVGDADGSHPFRLAGTRVCALFGRELKGESFVDLWDAASRPAVTDLLTILLSETVGTVAGVTARNKEGQRIDLELLLLPLQARRPAFARSIGILAPFDPPYWLGTNPIGALTLGTHRHVSAPLKPRVLPRLLAPRRGLVVYEGGRTN